MNRIQKIGAWIFNIKGSGASTSYPLDADLIERDSIINAMSKKMQSQDAQISQFLSEKKLKREQLNQEDFDKEQIQELKRQETDSNKNRFEGTIFLKDIYKNVLFKSKYYNKLELTDRKDKVVFGRFGDFCLLPNGWFGIVERDSNKVISYGPTLDHIIYKPESLGNQFRRGRILLPVDENFQHIPDIEKVSVPECMRDEDGGIVWAQVAEKPLLDMIQEKEESISEQQTYIEKLEKDKIGLVSENRDIKRALSLEQNTSENSQTELSKAMDKSIQFEQKIGGLSMRVIKMQEMKNINDKLLESLEKVNDDLLSKLEAEGSDPARKKAMDEIQNLITWAKDRIGKTTIIKEDKEEKSEENKIGRKIG